ncbi:MAG TPA: hypothetical protein VM581_00675 [Magnetospirillaceae bacterium]|nr:hypothetical protein [Magnetospirillaceae bacterium]
MNEVRIGVVGYCPPTRFDEEEAARLIVTAFDVVANYYAGRSIVIVSGLTNVGVLALAYAEAVKRGWRTVGITSARALEHPLFPVDEKHIVGENWGDESPTFVANIDALVRIGGGKQSHAEARIVASSGRPVFLYELEAL